VGAAEQTVELDRPVALDAWVGRRPGGMGSDIELDDTGVEVVGELEHVVRDVELLGDAPRVVDVGDRAAAGIARATPQLERHADVVKQSTARKGLDLGLRNYTRADLEAAQRAGEMLHINVLGLASIAQDVTAELARATIGSVSVLGALHATPAVKAALADRTR